LEEFLTTLESSLSRGMLGVTVVVLHGDPRQWPSAQEAIAYLQSYDESQSSPAPALKYEVDVRYNNGDVIHGVFQEKSEAIRFLQTFA
jgi:hypothetical protein